MQLLKKKDDVRRPRSIDPEREYWRGGFLDNIKERLAHRGEKIIVDIWQKTEIVAGKKGAYYSRSDRWTQATSDELHSEGYLPGVRVPGYDSIEWSKQKVYVRLLNFQQYDIHVKDDLTGRYLYSQDTPSTLHDEMTSNATQDFIKAMFKTTLPKMDVQKIIMIAILGVGAVFGLMMLGII